MKILRLSASIALVLLALLSGARAGSFDGNWAVTLHTPEYKDPTGVVARAYTFEFSAQVKNGLLQGEHGSKGQPGWLQIAGQIQTDGSALLHARGITGHPEYNLAHVASGRPYEYDVKAHFSASRGTGNRIGGRIGNYTFVKG